MYFVMSRPTGFGGKYLNTSHTENRKNGNRKEYNSQTADPLSHCPPEKDSVRHRFYIIHDGGTGTAEAGHCLEEGIGDTWNIPAYIIGQHSKKGESNPGYTDNHISIAAVE